MASRKIYAAYSLFDLFWYLILRGVILGGIIYCAQYYKENPPVVTAAIIILALFFMLVGSETITIYEDKVVQKHDSIYSLFFNKPIRTLFLHDLDKVWVEKKPEPKAVEIGIGLILAYLLPKQTATIRSEAIYFKKKDGTDIHILTSLREKEINRIVEIVEKLIRKKKK